MSLPWRMCDGGGKLKQYTDLKFKNWQHLVLLIGNENLKQIEKWGIQTHSAFEWLTYTAEELGSLAKAISEYEYRNGPKEKIVDEAYLGHEDDIYEIVEEIKPDIIALGFDQVHDKKKIEQELKKRNIKAEIIRLKKYNGDSDLEGTRKIISKIISAYEFHKSIERIEANEENRHS